MTFDEWEETQGFPSGFECIGRERMRQVWAAAIDGERAAIIKMIPGGDVVDPQQICDMIRERSNAALSGWPGKNEMETEK